MSGSNQTSNKLEGLLTVMPLEVVSDSNDVEQLNVNKTLYNDALSVWQNLFGKDDQGEYSHFHNISSFAMFAFDATWTLIKALNTTSFDGQSSIPWFNSSSYCFNSSLENAIQYHKHLNKMNFLGISGPISFSKNTSNDRVAGAYYVLKNLQAHKNQRNLTYKHIMKWGNESIDGNGQWGNFTEQHIVWPNRSQKIPPDYPQVRGEHLNIRVINAPPFVMLWNKSSMTQQKPSNTKNILETQDKNIAIYGYVADLIVELREKMGFTSTVDASSSNVSYNSLVEAVSNNNTWDIIISDVTITSDRLLIVDFSLPFYENAVRIVVRDSTSLSVDFLGYLRPFSLGVWLAIFGVIIYSGLLVYLFERRTIQKEENCRGLRAIIFSVYQALSYFVGMGNDLRLKTKSSRILTVALFTLSIILVATYTANLSSFLAIQRTQPYISGIDDIKNGRLPFHRIGILNGSAQAEYYKKNVSTIFYAVKNKSERFTLLLDNRIDAAIGDALALEYTVDREYCGRLLVVGVGFAKSSFGIVMAKNWQYKADFDVNILSLREEGKLDSLEQKWLSERICSSKNIDETWERDGIPMNVMTGLFASFLVASAIALILHLYQGRTAVTENGGKKVIITVQIEQDGSIINITSVQ